MPRQRSGNLCHRLQTWSRCSLFRTTTPTSNSLRYHLLHRLLVQPSRGSACYGRPFDCTAHEFRKPASRVENPKAKTSLACLTSLRIEVCLARWVFHIRLFHRSINIHPDGLLEVRIKLVNLAARIEHSLSRCYQAIQPRRAFLSFALEL
jgi:hypothetical protein